MCDMFDESSQCTIILPDECLGYGLVVTFPAYGFAALVSHNENLNSPKQSYAEAGNLTHTIRLHIYEVMEQPFHCAFHL